MKVVLICLFLILVIGIFLISRGPAKKPARKRLNAPSKRRAGQKSPASVASPYRAASINFADGACDAVRAMEGKRFLLDEIPHLPLHDCTAQNCDCKYLRYDDRREEDIERRTVSGLSTELYDQAGKPERRDAHRKRGRRDSDFED